MSKDIDVLPPWPGRLGPAGASGKPDDQPGSINQRDPDLNVDSRPRFATFH